MEKLHSCVTCGSASCRTGSGDHPEFCPGETIEPALRDEVMARYEEGGNRAIMESAAAVECEHYCSYTRVQEVIEFAHRMGFKRIGIATCLALLKESRTLRGLLERAGFEVYGVNCKVDEVDKLGFGLPAEHALTGPTLCNPIMQARLLQEANTDMNIVMGLCVGHDMLFNKYSHTLTTTLVVKDRVTGHNPCVALYAADGVFAARINAQIDGYENE